MSSARPTLMAPYASLSARFSAWPEPLSHPGLLFMDGSQEQISFSEPQFIEDDLRSLVDPGLLRLDYNSSGSRLFLFTRMAACVATKLKRLIFLNTCSK